MRGPPTLHLVRDAARPAPAGAVADLDWVVYLHPGRLELAAHGAPPLPTGPITHDDLVQLTFAAARTIAW